MFSFHLRYILRSRLHFFSCKQKQNHISCIAACLESSVNPTHPTYIKSHNFVIFVCWRETVVITLESRNTIAVQELKSRFGNFSRRLESSGSNGVAEAVRFLADEEIKLDSETRINREKCKQKNKYTFSVYLEALQIVKHTRTAMIINLWSMAVSTQGVA